MIVKNKLELLANQKTAFTSEQMFEIFMEVGKLGDVIIYKNDGLREKNHFTVIIIPGDDKFERIRFDATELHMAVRLSLTEYLKYIQLR